MIAVDEVITGLVVDAIAALGRQLTTQVASAGGSRRRREAVELASFFNTYALLDKSMPAPPAELNQDALAIKLRSNEVQALVQELLAVRLSDGPELVAQQIRQQLLQICSTSYAEQVFEELDSQIESVVVQISAAQPQVLNQIRQEAYFTRINATLEAIERHMEAMHSPHDSVIENQFWERYRLHVLEQHGTIEPPDFDRRRRVPIADLYVSPEIVREVSPEATDTSGHQVDLYNDKEIDRTVLLGSPGGGKTTASNVLLFRHAQDPNLRIPFLITLREFGANDPPQWSVAEYLAYRLRTFYQCTAPEGAINRLLLAGDAFVVFDGLDELIDTSRRAEMSAIIEQFCIEYPLTQILVTSRIVGYEEARLDVRQFRALIIQGFSDNLVNEYVNKWFAQEPDMAGEEAGRLSRAFMQESSDIRDLRSNPLMLSLICILYRGERSIPQSRSDVYEKCADLLFRKWDARRKIYVELRARYLIEPAVRYLAYWMLTRDQIQAAVTRRQLIAETTAYFQSRGFDENNDPAAAAEEFVDFCRGRAWVFSEVGSTGEGEQLYTFTHRTFMEYFAAYYLASINERPEQLARAIAPKVAKGEWDMVGQLAVQLKDRNVERGADRIFTTLLEERRKRTPHHRLGILEFLARSMAAVQPRPSIVKQLTVAILDQPTFFEDANKTLSSLINGAHDSAQAVADGLSEKTSELVANDDSRKVRAGLELACCLPVGIPPAGASEFWLEFSSDNISTYGDKIIEQAKRGPTMLWLAYFNGLISPDEVVSICADELGRLFAVYWYVVFRFGHTPPIYSEMSAALAGDTAHPLLMAALGRYLVTKNGTPRIKHLDGDLLGNWFFRDSFAAHDSDGAETDSIMIDGEAYLGLLFCVSLAIEAIRVVRRHRARRDDRNELAGAIRRRLSPLHDFLPYIDLRLGVSSDQTLPPLPVNDSFNLIFAKWAAGKISFTAGWISGAGPWDEFLG